jgi:YVTN family beta-propeller protein
MAVPIFLAVTPNGAFVYVSNALASDVRVIDTATNTIATKLASKTGAPEALHTNQAVWFAE